ADKRALFRAGKWLLAVACLLIVGLTVSRGAMFATALAITVAFRRLLRRGFVPVLLLIIVIGVVIESGLFDQVISHYTERGMEETGRERLWPEAIERIFASPLTTFIGVGMSNVGSDVLHAGWATPPHNTFLFFALSSGIIPLVLLIIFWFRAARKSFFSIDQSDHGPFRIPFLLYVFVIFNISDAPSVPWTLLALSVGAGPIISAEKRWLLARNRIRGRGTRDVAGRPFSGRNSTLDSILPNDR